MNTVVEAMAEPQFLARNLFVDHERTDAPPVKGVDVVPRLSDTPGRVRWAGPATAGTHNQEVYGDLLGLDDDEIAKLVEDGVV